MTDLTTHDLASKRPATVVRADLDDARTIDGRFRPVHGGPSLSNVLTVFFLVFFAAGLGGLILSLL